MSVPSTAIGLGIIATLGAVPMLSTRPESTSARFPKGLSPMQLGPPPNGLSDWSEASCASCHRREAEAWKLSGHASARTGFVFQAALTHDDPTWCLRCHAPLAEKVEPGPVAANASAEERGVTCAACHAGAHGIVAPTAVKSPHAIEVAPRGGGSALCAQCHEFGFPRHAADGSMIGLTSAPAQQDTFGEWTRWQLTSGDSRGCLDCHGGGDHALGGVRRTSELAHAIEVRATSGALTLQTRGTGHALPTGDVMRWLTVEAASEPLFESPIELARFGRELGLTTDPGDPAPHRTIVRDVRLEPGKPVRISVPSTDSVGRKLQTWRLVLHLESLQQEAAEMIPSESSRVVLETGYLDTPQGKP